MQRVTGTKGALSVVYIVIGATVLALALYIVLTIGLRLYEGSPDDPSGVADASGAEPPAPESPPEPSPPAVASGGSEVAGVVGLSERAEGADFDASAFSERRVTFRAERISIQTAAQSVCEQAGYQYDWPRSHLNTRPDCRRYIRVDVFDLPLRTALDAIVKDNGLTYCIEGRNVWLKRPE